MQLAHCERDASRRDATRRDGCAGGRAAVRFPMGPGGPMEDAVLAETGQQPSRRAVAGLESTPSGSGFDEISA